MMSWMFSSLRLPSKEGIMPLRPVSMVERTTSSVADLPLGRNLRSKTPCRSGGIFSRSSLLRLWQPLQCISNRCFPRAMATARRPSQYEHPDDPGNTNARVQRQINCFLWVERNIFSTRDRTYCAPFFSIRATENSALGLRQYYPRVFPTTTGIKLINGSFDGRGLTKNPKRARRLGVKVAFCLTVPLG